ncbi:hypothetical protein IIU_05716 [Bacillus cereus VD133]|uniref:Uncharacterized protein n=1 Tax=Bacillus cereus VD133 TaxID=1053233 RepID=A0A9W5PLW2_BACCE|nr:hypothetical protein IIU_05716 [Bacillus cereus VD133]
MKKVLIGFVSFAEAYSLQVDHGRPPAPAAYEYTGTLI